MLACEYLRVENCKINIKQNCDRLFANVKRCYMSNCCIKDSWPVLFSNNLKELILKRNQSQSPQAIKVDICKKVI